MLFCIVCVCVFYVCVCVCVCVFFFRYVGIISDIKSCQVIQIKNKIVFVLKVIYKGFFKSFIVLYADRICPEHHFVENRIENFPSV